MSLQAFTWAAHAVPRLHNGLPDHTAGCMLGALAEFAGKNGENVHPGVARLEDMTGLSRRGAYAVLSRLEKDGWIERTGKWQPPRGRPVVIYRLVLERENNLVHAEPHESDPDLVHARGAQNDDGLSAPGTPTLCTPGVAPSVKGTVKELPRESRSRARNRTGHLNGDGNTGLEDHAEGPTPREHNPRPPQLEELQGDGQANHDPHRQRPLVGAVRDLDHDDEERQRVRDIIARSPLAHPV